jgi:hypothetical protein
LDTKDPIIENENVSNGDLLLGTETFTADIYDDLDDLGQPGSGLNTSMVRVGFYQQNSSGAWEHVGWYYMNNTSGDTWSVDVDTSGLTDGDYQLRYNARDMADNRVVSIFYVTVDNTAPEKPTNLHRRTEDGSETYACGDVAPRMTLIPDWDDNTESDFSHYEYSSFHPDGTQGLDERVLNDSEFVHSWTPPADGTYGYAVRAVDHAGNKSDWALISEDLDGSCKITYDSIAPVVEITAPEDGDVFGSEIVEIRGTVQDDNPWRYYTVIRDTSWNVIDGPGTVYDDTPFVDEFLFNWDTSTVAEGEYIVWLAARDQAGNRDANSEDYITVYVDHTPPSIPENISFEVDGNLSLACGTSTNSEDVTVIWDESSDNYTPSADIMYEYEVTYTDPVTGAESAWTTTLSDPNFSGSFAPNGEGLRTIRVRAIDNVGNVSDWSDPCTIYYDPTQPVVDELTDATYSEGDTVPVITVNASDNYELDEIRAEITLPDGSTMSTYDDISSGTYDLTADIRATMPLFDTSIMYEGDYVVEYWVTDEAGNESTHYTVTYTLENVAPSITSFTASATNITEGDTVNFSGTFTDPSYLPSGNLGGSPDDSNWTVEINYGEGGGFQQISNPSQPGTATGSHQYNSDGSYTVTMRVCEAPVADNPLSEEVCTTETLTVTVNNPPAPPAPPAPQGGFVQVVEGEEVEEEAEEEETDTEETDDEGEVLGERTCDETSKVSGYVYIDSNGNGEKDDDEEGIEDVTVWVYYYNEEDERVDVAEVETDEDGYWEAEVCPGSYKVEVEEDDVPDDAVLGQTDQDIEVEEDEDLEDVSFGAEETRNSMSWIWWALIILLIVAIAAILLYIVGKDREEDRS